MALLGDQISVQRHPRSRSGVGASRVWSNYKPDHLGIEVNRAMPGDFQRKQVTNFRESVNRHVQMSANQA